jgi:hypothetical protein
MVWLAIVASPASRFDISWNKNKQAATITYHGDKTDHHEDELLGLLRLGSGYAGDRLFGEVRVLCGRREGWRWLGCYSSRR